jgi:hypothetical protein
MDKEQMALRVMGLINAKVRELVHKNIQASMQVGSAESGRREWQAHNPDDGVGGFSQNPYAQSLEAVRKRYGECGVELAEWQAIQEFFTTTFIKGHGPQ